MKRILIALAVMSGTASAQPGETPPVDPQPPPPPDGPVEVQAQVQADASASLDLDGLLERAHALSPTIGTIARGTFRRARRAISIGPTLGFWGAGVLKQDEIETALTFGLGLELFKVPVLPSPENLKAIVIERAKSKLKKAIAARFVGVAVEPVVVEELVREVWEESIKEVLGLENVRPKTMERPRLTIAFEVNRRFNFEAWEPRLRAGIGIWKFTLAASGSIALGSDAFAKTPVYAGLEIVTHFLVSKNPRASVFDVFVRADFELRNRDDQNGDQLVLGIRYLLDII